VTETGTYFDTKLICGFC